MERLNAIDLVKSEKYVREPVDKEIEEILSSNKRNIILAGNRGTGRSTVLRALENRGLGTKEQTINLSHDPLIFMSKEPSLKFNKELFNYVYELIFVNDILCYVKNNYPLAFEKYFKNDKELINKFLHEFDEQLNHCWYKDATFKTNKEPNKMLIRTLNKIFDKLNVEKLNIAIDVFDKINGSSEYVQRLYEKKFHLFNKTIIVVDDPKIDEEKLSNAGYDIRKITYGKNRDVLREIIRRRYAEDEIKRELYTQDVFVNKLARQGDNIRFKLDVSSYIDMRLAWYPDNIEKIIDMAIKCQKEEDKKLQKIMTKPTLYL